jgi:serine/threonine protein kinase
VLVGHDGRVRVTDFGLARPMLEETDSPPKELVAGLGERPSSPALTRDGALVGTPAYMAPEQIEGHSADERSDIFSFCVAVYEALYGTRPFPGSTLEGRLRAIRSGEAAIPTRGTEVPSALRHALLVGLRCRPEERPASMEAMLARLRSAVDPPP